MTAVAGAQMAAPESYYEFGTVVAQHKASLDLQTFDPQRQRVVQHSFVLSRETRADAVHVGDSVEAIYTVGVGDRLLRRLILLPGGVPIAGPPPLDTNAGPAGNRAGTLTGTLPPATSATTATAASAAHPETLPPATVPTARPVSVAKAGKPSAARPATPVAPAASAAAPGAGIAKAVPAATGKAAVRLSSTAASVAPPVHGVALGTAAGSGAERTPTARTVHQSRPAEECNRSSTDWPTDPVRIVVIDFRYPTEREEAHDVGTTGGGSGTAVADLVFDRMEALQQADTHFAFSRGDRRRLDRTDFAGAARLGRQLGVDAVLAGTFAPVTTPAANSNDPYAQPIVTYELRAGLVDTCTGQLLMRLSSVSCPQAPTPGIDPGMSGEGVEPCRRFAVASAEANDPRAHAAAFGPPLDAMLYPLEHNETPLIRAGAKGAGRSEQGSAGAVTRVQGRQVSVRLPAGIRLQAGEQVGVHAWRLAKNPITYTLHNLHDEEIGRVTLTRIAGEEATGVYMGDFPPLPGDTADLIPAQ